jgi:hypothetical protein
VLLRVSNGSAPNKTVSVLSVVGRIRERIVVVDPFEFRLREE